MYMFIYKKYSKNHIQYIKRLYENVLIKNCVLVQKHFVI